MKNDKTLLILWIIFGFLFIYSLDIVLKTLVDFIYFSVCLVGISYRAMQFVIPVITLIVYGVSTFILLRKITNKEFCFDFNNFPKVFSYVLIILPYPLAITSNYLFGLYDSYLDPYLERDVEDYLNFYAVYKMALSLTRTLVLLTLLVVLTKKLNKST